MKKVYALSALLFSIMTFGQVQQKVLVEHFTNSRCSICANRNPNLFTNLDNNPQVTHLAFHPSSPYSSCVFNQHNSSENDLRTNFYNVYGGTPRIVINGQVDNNAFGSSTLFTSYQGQTTPFDLSVSHSLDSDSVYVSVVVRVVSSGADAQYYLTVGVAEDTIFYNAPNGENVHRNVFRRFAVHNGVNSTPSIGDSSVFRFAIPRHVSWSETAVFGFAMVQKANKEMEQSGRSDALKSTVGMGEMNPADFRIYPVPADDRVQFDKFVHFQLFDVTGRVMNEGFADQMRTKDLPEGMYLLRLNVQGVERVLRLPVVH